MLIVASLTALLTSSTPLSSDTRVISGAVTDALAVESDGEVEIWLTKEIKNTRTLIPFVTSTTTKAAREVRVPSRAVFVDLCAVVDDRVEGASSLSKTPGAARARFMFVDGDGVVDEGGYRWINAPTLFPVADASALFLADVCTDGAPGELRVAVRDGIKVRTRAGLTHTLSFEHRARSYSGRVHRGLRPSRAYHAALSTYAPHMFDVDIDGDGANDLVISFEDRVTVFLREKSGALRTLPAVDLSLTRAIGLDAADDEQDLRVLVGDVDGDARTDLLIGVTAGALPERSQTWLLSSEKAPLSTVKKLWDTDGLVAPIDIVQKDGRARLLVSEVDTSMMALGAVLLSGSVDVKVTLRDVDGTRTSGPVLTAAVDIRRAKMSGALPIVDVDFDGDGVDDLLDLGTPGRASIHRGTADGYEARASSSVVVPAFVHVVGLPTARAVVLVGAPMSSSGKVLTSVAVVSIDDTAATTKNAREARTTSRAR